MEDKQKKEIEHISKQFASEFKNEIGGIAGSGWLIVDPLCGYLNFMGHGNTVQHLEANSSHPQILIITFTDGTQFIPAGSDMPVKGAKDWMWID